MAGCSIVVLMSLLAVAGLAVIIAALGAVAFCLVLGIVLLVVSFIVLKKKDDSQKYRTLRIVLTVIGFLSLLIGAFGILALAASYISFSSISSQGAL